MKLEYNLTWAILSVIGIVARGGKSSITGNQIDIDIDTYTGGGLGSPHGIMIDYYVSFGTDAEVLNNSPVISAGAVGANSYGVYFRTGTTSCKALYNNTAGFTLPVQPATSASHTITGNT